MAAALAIEYCSGCWVAQERGCVVLGYATAAVILSQERIHMSVVPMAPQVSSQLLSSCLVYTGYTVQAMWTARQLVSWTGWGAIQTESSRIIKGLVCKENDIRFYSVAAENPLKNIEQQSNRIMSMLEPLSWRHYGACIPGRQDYMTPTRAYCRRPERRIKDLKKASGSRNGKGRRMARDFYKGQCGLVEGAASEIQCFTICRQKGYWTG